MISKRQLATLMWMVIVTIAVALVPTIALAHGGHSHGQVSISRVTHDPAVTDTVELHAERTKVEVAVTAGNGYGNAAPSCSCNGGCCATGFSCCAPALASASIAYLPDHLNELEVVRPAVPMRPGIDPEALPEPPKSFA